MDSTYFILYILTFLLIPAIITQKKKPVSALAWVMAVIFLPFAGAFLYLLFGTGRIRNKGRQKLSTNIELRSKMQDIEAKWVSDKSGQPREKLSAEISDIMNISSKFSPFGAAGNNKLEILTDTEETYEKMETAIRSAEHHINIEYYIFRPDTVGARFRDLLAQKAREGIKVNFLYDAFGSMSLGWGWSFLEGFYEAGIEPQEFLPLRTFFKPWNMNLRNHRKILIVDNRIGFTGGLNIGEKYLNKNGRSWRDTQIMIEGPAVTQLEWVFFEDWYFATGEDLFEQDYFLPSDTSGEYIVQVVPRGPDESGEVIQRIFFTALSQAKSSIYLTTPYFIPDQTVDLALQMAALRGVDVRLLLPSKSDHRVVKLAGRSYYDDLLQNGVRIFEYLPGTLHGKMLVVDGSFVVIGSANVNSRSFRYDFEVNVQVYGEEFARIAEKIFLEDLTNSRELSLDTFSKRPSYIRFGENFCRLFSPLL